MKIICLIFCFLSLCLSISAKPQPPASHCKEKTCYIENVKVRAATFEEGKSFIEQLNVNVESLPEKNVATELVIKDSRIDIFGVGLCKVFPSLAILRAENSSIFLVFEDAFKDCTHLTEIYLGSNDIRVLEPETFTRNTKLQIISLAKNAISSLDPHQFSGLALLHLNLSRNDFNHICPYIFRSATELRSLDLSHNHLVDFNVEKLLSFFPNFHEINLSDNDFRCARLKEIVEKLKGKQVIFGHSDVIVRKRPFDDKVEGYVCLNDENYMKHVKDAYTKVKKVMDHAIREMADTKTVFDRYNEILEEHTGEKELLV